ncbi:MAG: fibronectin type III domain-containing protein [Candidatus Cohnella colombiensis]|uniref:Fibronectin type III domain-containing protein n=1 Tax=Candidatus Cohnella colombiensis TaxID=3121368 RepID=A0AA95JGQ5_9BACL|nr:MAG: fibronectin type III domain-containing protein [Cohnella sp.]
MRFLRKITLLIIVLNMSILSLLNVSSSQASAASQSAPSVGNLLKNSDFESVTGSATVADNWTKTVQSGATGFFQVVDTGDAALQRAQQVSGTAIPSGKGVWISQTIAVLPDSEYILSGQFRVINLEGAKVQLWVDFLDTNNAYIGAGFVDTTTVSGDFITLNKNGITPPKAAKAMVYAILRSTSANGSGSFEVDAMRFTLIDTQPPTAPLSLAVSHNGGTNVGLSWSASTDNLGVAAYDIYNGNEWIGSTPDTFYSVYGLVPGTSYTFSVQAKDAAGNVSSRANVDVIMTEDRNLLRNSDFESVTGNATVADHWTKTVQSGTTGSFQVVDTGDATLQRTQQVSGTAMPSGKGVWISQTIAVAADSEYNLNGRFKVNHLTGAKVQLWVDFLDANNANIGAGFVETSTVSGNFITLNKNGITPPKAAKAMVYAILRSTSANGSGSFEVDALRFTLIDTQPPSTPLSLIVSHNGGTNAGLSWSASTDNLGVAAYDIYNGNEWIGSTPETFYSVYGLVPGTSYTFSVQAKDAAGNVSSSAVVDVIMTEDRNLLRNSDFESVTGNATVADFWSKTVQSGTTGSFQVVDTGDATIQRAQQVSGSAMPSGKGVWISQTIAVAADSEYNLNGRFKVNHLTGAKVQLWVDFLDANNANIGAGFVETSTVSGNFITLNKNGKTPPKAAKAMVYAILRSTSANGSGSFEVDAMRFTITPPTSTSKDIIEVASNGSIIGKLGSPLPLPVQIDATLSDGNSIQVEVAWELRNEGYDDLIALNKPFVITGQLINLPSGVTNSQGLIASINVRTNAILDIKEIITVIPPLTLAHSAEKYDLYSLLPNKVEVMMDDHSRHSVYVWWDLSNFPIPTNNNAHSFTITGNIELPIDENPSTQQDGKSITYTNSKNLGLVASITLASQSDSSNIIQSILYVSTPYEVEKHPNPTPESIGLPSQAQVKLGNNSTITTVISWEIVQKDMYYQVTGTLANLPTDVINPGFYIRTSIFAYEQSDIKEVPYLVLKAAHGAPKTTQGLGLPEQITVKLYNGQQVSLPVSWELDRVTYDPSIRTAQWVYVSGQFNDLPAGVTNGRRMSANAQIEVAANPNNIEINSYPASITSQVATGVPKTAAGLGLPDQIEVSLSNGSRISVDVNWRLDWVSYNPQSTTTQSFWVTGNFVNLPEGIYNSYSYSVSAYVTVKDRYITRYSNVNRTVNHGATKTVEGLELPAQVEALLDDNSKVMLDVNWNVGAAEYDTSFRLEQYFWVYGTVTNLPAGIINVYDFYKASAYIHVTADPTNRHITSSDPITLYTVVEHGVPATVEGFGLPQQVEVTLSDNSKINVDVSWDMSENFGYYVKQEYNPEKISEQYLTIMGSLTNLPEGIYNSNRVTVKASVKVKGYYRDIVGYVHQSIQKPNGTPKNLEAFGLPSTFEAILDDGSKINLDVQWRDQQQSYYWNTYSPDRLEYQSFFFDADFINLPNNIRYNSVAIVSLYVEVWAHPSVKNILSIPQKSIELINGFQLPRKVDVQLDNGNMMELDVLWNFTKDRIYGTFNLPNGVNNYIINSPEIGFENGSEATIRDIYSQPNPPGWPYEWDGYKIISLEPVDLFAGEQLPAQVQATVTRFSQQSTIAVNICWYDGPTDGNYKVGVPCGNERVYNQYNKVAVAYIHPITITNVQQFNEVIPYEDLPSQVSVQLSNGTTIRTNVCWIRGSIPPVGQFTVVGVLCDLPTGVKFSTQGYVFAETYMTNGSPVEEPEVTPHKVVSVQQFNEIMSEYDLPKTVKITLDSGQTISTPVCWHAVNLQLLKEDDIAISTGNLCDLPAGEITNPHKLYSLAYIHKSVSDLYFDFDTDTNDPSVEEQVKNVRFVNSSGKIKIHVTSYDHPINSATATYNGKTIQLEKISDNEFIAVWKPDVTDRGLGVKMSTTEAEAAALNGKPINGAFHSFEVKIYPKNDTIRYIRKQVYVAIRDINDFKSIVTNLPMPRIIAPADARYNCLGFVLDIPQYTWYWFNNDYTAPIYPTQEEVILRLDIAGYTQTFDLNEATVLAFGSNGQIFHFAKYDPETGTVTSKDAVEEIVEMNGIPEYSGRYGTAQLYFKKTNP